MIFYLFPQQESGKELNIRLQSIPSAVGRDKDKYILMNRGG